MESGEDERQGDDRRKGGNERRRIGNGSAEGEGEGVGGLVLHADSEMGNEAKEEMRDGRVVDISVEEEDDDDVEDGAEEDIDLDIDAIPASQEEGQKWWRREIEARFLRGDDEDFDYRVVDENEEFDDWDWEDRRVEEDWFEGEEPVWVRDEDPGGSTSEEGRAPIGELRGQTGVQDF